MQGSCPYIVVGGTCEALFGLWTTISNTSTLRTCKKISANRLKFNFNFLQNTLIAFFRMKISNQSMGSERVGHGLSSHTHTHPSGICTRLPSRASYLPSWRAHVQTPRSPARTKACSSGPGGGRPGRGWRDTRCKSPACPRFRQEHRCPPSRPSRTLHFKQKTWATLASLCHFQMKSSALSSPFQRSKT